MNEAYLLDALGPALAAVAGGLATGLLYFRLLRWTTAAIAEGAGWRRPALLTLARVLGISALLVLAAQWGALPLLAGFLGFLAARIVALRQARRAA